MANVADLLNSKIDAFDARARLDELRASLEKTMLRAIKEPVEPLDLLGRVIDAALAIGATSGPKERPAARGYVATIKYRAGTAVIETAMTFGPTSSRDAAAALARAWLDSHAALARSAPVHEVKIDEVILP